EFLVSEYLLSPDDHLSWQTNSLIADNLCTENVVTLKDSVLNESEVNILNDTKILDTLKKLKQEATQIILMIESMDNYVKETITQYTHLAHSYYITFAILLSQIKFYRFLDQIEETKLDVIIAHKIKESIAFPCSSRLNKHINKNVDKWKQFKKYNVPEEQMPKFLSIVMDSNECFTLADQAIEVSIKKENWVLLKNVYLATLWLEQLKKMFHSLKLHRNFRLFLTMEMNTKV
ncbi:38143_t:CDS:2, partial [Gigaspora margarita]